LQDHLQVDPNIRQTRRPRLLYTRINKKPRRAQTLAELGFRQLFIAFFRVAALWLAKDAGFGEN